VAPARFLGVDLAWREAAPERPANESGVASIDISGHVVDAGWTRGLEETAAWIDAAAGGDPVLLFVDAPLIVTNASGQRACETQVGQRYGRWKVSANTTNLHTPRLAGVRLREMLETRGWSYSDGTHGPARRGRAMSECYPYTTLVGAFELGYETERPRYKRKPPKLRVAQWRPERAVNCDRLIGRIGRLAAADPPLLLDSHPVTRRLADQPSPLDDTAYKHREDLIDALLCAWTASLWARHGQARCQVLGPSGGEGPAGPAATIIAPARLEQRVRR
jgi:predicted RNase H-like nuclease